MAKRGGIDNWGERKREPMRRDMEPLTRRCEQSKHTGLEGLEGPSERISGDSKSPSIYGP